MILRRSTFIFTIKLKNYKKKLIIMKNKLVIVGFALLIIAIFVLSIFLIKCNTSKFGNIIDKEKKTNGCNKVEEFEKIRNFLEQGLYNVKTSMNRDSSLNEGPSFIGDAMILSNKQNINMYKISTINDLNFTNGFSNLEIDIDLQFKFYLYDLNNTIVSSRIGYVVEINKDKFVVNFSGTSKTTNVHSKNGRMEFIKRDFGFTIEIFDDSNNLVRITNYKKK